MIEIYSSSSDSNSTGNFFYIYCFAVLTHKIVVLQLFEVVKLSVLAALRLCLFSATRRWGAIDNVGALPLLFTSPLPAVIQEIKWRKSIRDHSFHLDLRSSVFSSKRTNAQTLPSGCSEDLAPWFSLAAFLLRTYLEKEIVFLSWLNKWLNWLLTRSLSQPFIFLSLSCSAAFSLCQQKVMWISNWRAMTFSLHFGQTRIY